MYEEPIDKGLQRVADSGYVIRGRLLSDHVAEFEVFTLMVLDTPEGEPSEYVARDDVVTEYAGVTNDIEEAEMLLSVTIKWDGCQDWFIGETNVSTHLCGRHGLYSFHKMMCQCLEWAALIIPKWDA